VVGGMTSRFVDGTACQLYRSEWAKTPRINCTSQKAYFTSSSSPSNLPVLSNYFNGFWAPLARLFSKKGRVHKVVVLWNLAYTEIGPILHPAVYRPQMNNLLT
jgi:hypothetical protein